MGVIASLSPTKAIVFWVAQPEGARISETEGACVSIRLTSRDACPVLPRLSVAATVYRPFLATARVPERSETDCAP